MEQILQNNSEIKDMQSHYCMIARYHWGDENGKSNAKFARLTLSEEARQAGFVDVWLAYDSGITMKESNSHLEYDIEKPRVITRRIHSGDENGKTVYELASVIARKENDTGIFEEERSRLYMCVAEDIEVVTNGKESKAQWVQSSAPNKVIIGRNHYKDENGKTETIFASLSIVEKLSKKKYPLVLTDIKTLNECKESKSDFSVDAPVHDTKLKLWTKKAFNTNFLDHTWVESIDPSDEFRCKGGTDKNRFLHEFQIPHFTYYALNEVRDKDDSIGILYGICGVCHQMANRFLYPSGRSITQLNLEERPKGYNLSSALYGTYGYDFSGWRDKVYQPAYNKYAGRKNEKASVENVFVFSYKAELEKLKTFSKEYFADILTTEMIEGVHKAQGEWLTQITDILSKYEFLSDDGKIIKPESISSDKVTSMYMEIIQVQEDVFKKIRGVVGIPIWKKLNNGSPDIIDIVSVEEALSFYESIIE